MLLFLTHSQRYNANIKTNWYFTEKKAVGRGVEATARQTYSYGLTDRCWQADRHLNRCACRYNRVNTTFYICRYLNVKEPENYAFLCYNAFFGFTSLFLFWYHKLEVVWHSLIGFLVQCETLRMYLCWSLCTLYWHAYQVRVTVGDSCLRCCVCVTSFERWLTPLCFFSFSSPVQVVGKESRDRAAEGNPGYTFHCTFTIVSF